MRHSEPAAGSHAPAPRAAPESDFKGFFKRPAFKGLDTPCDTCSEE